MTALRISLLGKPEAYLGPIAVDQLDGSRVEELFYYLLLNREQPRPRDVLAELFWPDQSSDRARSCLRKVLWQLQSTLDLLSDDAAEPLFLVDNNWVQVNPDYSLWLDVQVLEQVFLQVRDISPSDLSAEQTDSMKQAVHLYRGDLLDGWYVDWCFYERERFQYMYLTLLDKLMGYCEALGLYEQGAVYGVTILRYDRAHERTHRQLMRIFYLANDRTQALRQYERCVAALREELDVAPSKLTRALYEHIKADSLDVRTEMPMRDSIQQEIDMALAQLRQLNRQLEIEIRGVQQFFRQQM